jgi:hypothetical protein
VSSSSKLLAAAGPFLTCRPLAHSALRTIDVPVKALRFDLHQYDPLYCETVCNATAFLGEKTNLEETLCRRLKGNFFLLQAGPRSCC